MTPEAAYEYLRCAIPLRPELRFKTWPKVPECAIDLKPYQGACFIATQVFCKLVVDAIPYSNPDRSHFWPQIGDKVYDPTWDQFSTAFDYSTGQKTHFKTFSKRSRELYAKVETLTNS